MKATEWRLGNIMLIRGNDEDEFEVKQIEHGDFGFVEMFIEKYGWSLDTYYRPIPITPEWAVRCGFKHEKYEDAEWFETEFPVIGELCTSTDGTYIFDMDTDSLRITHVHQLQNIHFALTGEELTIEQ